MGRIVGIDLGTTNSCVGIFLPDTGQIEIVANRLGKNTTPSWVGFTANGRIVVGERARNCRPMIYDAKRMIGQPYPEVEKQEFFKDWNFPVTQTEN